jgi:hypothetical protein
VLIMSPTTSSRPRSSVASRRRTRKPADEATKLLAGHPPVHDTRQAVVYQQPAIHLQEQVLAKLMRVLDGDRCGP